MKARDPAVMTRCCRDSMNLKSTAYNQTGQNCVDQLTAYRTMCTHLRRVLMAKSVVDTRNPRYARSIQRRCRPTICKLRFLEREFCCPSDETIDKLAYDTEHHPSEVIRVTCRSKCSPKGRSRSRDREREVCCDANCTCLRTVSTGKGQTPSGRKSNLKNHKRTDEDLTCPDCCQLQQDFDKQQICDSKSDVSPCRSSRKWSLHEETAAADSPCGDDQTLRKLVEREEDEALYAKFIYDITQEIVQNGLYTDRELKEVFNRHIDRNSPRLNKRKMLYEIYQLKISLHMLDGSEDEDETEADLVFAEKFSSRGVPKPPTPPKVLNEDKVIEKLQSYKNHENIDYSASSSPTGRKGVTLVDANPEFLVTERDFLAALADNQVEPQQIQRIFRNLFQKSKDMSLYEAVQVGSEVAYTHRLKHVDRSTSVASLHSSYMKERPQGILRKESTDFLGKSLSPETSRRRYSYLLDKRNEALEKCSKWKTSPCDCKAESGKEHLDLVEKEKPQSPKKMPSKEVSAQDKPLKKPSDKKVKVVRRPTQVKRVEKLEVEEPIKVVVKEKQVKSSPRISDRRSISISSSSSSSSSVREVVAEEKQDTPRRTPRRQEAVEEIEEDIESVIEEPLKRSPRKSVVAQDKPDDEEKEQASLPEKNSDEESIASDNESIKYSDDFSDVSEDSSDNASKTSISSSTKKKVNRARYPSMKDYFDRFATFEDQKIWRISEGSSSSSSSATNLSMNQRGSMDSANDDGPPTGKAMKMRTSSSIFRSGEQWRDRLSGMSSDFYTSAVAKYCDADCRQGNEKSCSDNCRFVRTNCRNLSRPTDCLSGFKQTVIKSESTSTSS